MGARNKRHRRNECGKKKDFKSRREAEEAAARVGRQSLGYVHAYRCRFCSCWHIGHARANNSKKPKNKGRGLR